MASTVEIDDSGRFLVRLRGRVETDDIRRLSDDLLPRLEKLETGGGKLIFDLIELDSISTDARLELTEVQRTIAKHEARTAFVADRPRFRGIGLFVAHVSEDRNARAFHRFSQAETWLMAEDGRLENLANWREKSFWNTKPRVPKRRSSDELISRVVRLKSSSDDGEEDPK
ncbi:MAG: STAS/SEC14 domain-containing protein [Myxococcales bacterium]|nr:STAS/SEC14 domain-containing protein [Myxococcales bacterium]